MLIEYSAKEHIVYKEIYVSFGYIVRMQKNRGLPGISGKRRRRFAHNSIQGHIDI
jgi:hypothetical protein